MIDAMRRVLGLLSVSIWLLLAATLANPAFGQTRASPAGPLAPASLALAQTGATENGLRGSWWRDHFSLRLRGLEYRDQFVFRRQNLRLRLSGPVVKGNPGLRVELRGWKWRGTSTSFSAYGSAKRQGFKFKIAF